MRLFCIAEQVGLAEVILGLLVQDCLVSQDKQDHLVKKDLLDNKDPKVDKDSKDNQVRFKDWSKDLDLLEWKDQFYQVYTILINLLVYL